jgi:hypothetical protein
MTVKRIFLLSTLGLFIMGFAVANPNFHYVGSKKCASCHKTKKIGSQYVKWLQGRHSHAYWRLVGEWAKFLAQQREKYKDITEPINEARCLKCHVTGYHSPADTLSGSFSKKEGVGCESCHGPGSAYVKLGIMKDREKFLANGGIIPNEKTCRKCHRDDRFLFEEAVKKISHPIPKEDL